MRAGVVVAMLISCWCASARAQFGIFKVADTSTPIPNGTGNFTAFDHSPVFAGGGIAFRASGAGQEGIYVGGQVPLYRAADRNTILPGTSSPFVAFGSPSGAVGNVVFNGSNATRTGIYEVLSGGAVQTIDDGPAANTVFGPVAGSDSVFVQPTTLVTYRKNGQIFTNRFGGTIRPFTFTPPVGVSEVQFIGDPDIGTFDFYSGSIASPIAISMRYMRNGQSHGGVAVGNRIVFETLLGSPGPASINYGGTVATKMDPIGIRYVVFGSEPTIPYGSFTDFGTVAAGSPNLGAIDTHVVFVGQVNGGAKGIFVEGHQYGLREIVRVGQVLDGRVVQDVDLGRDSEFDVSFAFWVSFTDGSEGIYRAVVPEPVTGIVIVASALIATGRQIRRLDISNSPIPDSSVFS
jgi:hypothetical protein